MSGQLILGKDVANNNYVPISVDSSGHLDIDVQVADLDSKCMGSETGATDGTQHQLRVDNTGALHIISENADSMLIKGVDNGAPGVQRDCKQNSNGDLRSALVGNTAKDGTGTNYYVVVDADGKLETTAGDATAANQATQIANQGTINTSIGTVNTSVGTVNSSIGDTNSKIDAMRGTSDLGVINTSLGTVNSSIGDTNSKIDAMRGTSDLGVVNTSLGTVNTSIGDTNSKIDAMRGTSDLGVINTSLGTVNSSIGDTNSKIDAMRGTSDLGVVNTSLGTVNTSVGTVNTSVGTLNTTLTNATAQARCMGNFGGAQVQIKVDTNGVVETSGGGGGGGDATAANQTTMITHLSEIEGAVETIETCVSGTELQVDVITSALPTGAATQATLADVEAHQGNIENNLSSIQSTVSSNKLQVDVITSALPSGAATETTLAAAEAHIGTIDTSTASVAGCVAGTEVQVDVRNRTDSAPVALTFSAGNKIIAASGTTRTGTIDVGGCSSYVIMMNMLVATTNSSELSNTDVSIEYSPDDGSTFMGTSSSGGGGLETTSPLPLYQASGTSGGTIVGYGVYIQSTTSFSNPLMGVARTNKIRLAVQNPFGSSLTLDTFAIYKFN